jgi:hypothetical protein
MTSLRVRLAVCAVSATLASALLTGCGGDGVDTDCSLAACTVTFDRGVDAQTSILGVNVKLAGVRDNQVTVNVAGQDVDVPIGSTEAEAESNGLHFRVQEVTDSTVVLKVSRN